MQTRKLICETVDLSRVCMQEIANDILADQTCKRLYMVRAPMRMQLT